MKSTRRVESHGERQTAVWTPAMEGGDSEGDPRARPVPRAEGAGLSNRGGGGTATRRRGLATSEPAADSQLASRGGAVRERPVGLRGRLVEGGLGLAEPRPPRERAPRRDEQRARGVLLGGEDHQV